MDVRLDSQRLLETKYDRNSGRTFDALHDAILKTETYPCVAFIATSNSELRRLSRDIGIICEHYAIPWKEARPGEYEVGKSTLLTLNAHYYGPRGCRVYFVIDHSCSDTMSPSQFEELMVALSCAHAGDDWNGFRKQASPPAAGIS